MLTLIRAGTAVVFVAFATLVEDMYRPERFGRTDTGTIDIGTAK